ncbi:MAG: YHS domain-containing protein [Chloroflexi bacterium]|nr:YHS domain-containing protein [Chloroflexota bacterium]
MIDPVCGMRVAPEQSPARTIYGDKTFWFCSDTCRDRFDADPQRYIALRYDVLKDEGQVA